MAIIAPDYFVLEDGSAKTDSNAYWDIDNVIKYMMAKGAVDFASYTVDQQAQAIINATMYIEKRFKRRYRGLRRTVEQALGWPRIGAFDDDAFTIFGIPKQIKWATAEYAARAIRIGTLAPDPMRTVPAQDLSQPVAGVTPGKATLAASANFSDGDMIVIGPRVYTLQAALTQVDGSVLIGGSLIASLYNLIHAINNNGGIAGTDYYVTQADQNVVASLDTPASMLVTCMKPNANSVKVATTATAASWGNGVVALSGYSNAPKDPSLILGPIRSKTQKVGPLESSLTYDGLAQRGKQDERTTRAAQSGIVNDYYIPEYPEADLWLEQIIRNPATGTRLIRGT